MSLIVTLRVNGDPAVGVTSAPELRSGGGSTSPMRSAGAREPRQPSRSSRDATLVTREQAGWCSRRLTLSAAPHALDRLVAPLLRAHDPVALARQPQIGIGLRLALADEVGVAQDGDDRHVLLSKPA